MPHNAEAVTLFKRLPKQEELRPAVSLMIATITAQTGHSAAKIAETIGVAPITVRAWRDRTADIGSHNIALLGAAYGGDVTNPYHALYGYRVVPIENDEAINALPALTGIIHELTRSNAIGQKLPHTTLVAIAPSVRTAMRGLTSLQHQIDHYGIAA